MDAEGQKSSIELKQKRDIWGFGVMFHQMLRSPKTGCVFRDVALVKRHLRDAANNEDKVDAQIAFDKCLQIDTFSECYPEETRFCEDAAKLIKMCLRVDPDERTTFTQTKDALRKFNSRLKFSSKHGTSCVYHVLEPQDCFSCKHLDRRGSPETKKAHTLGDHVTNGSNPRYYTRFVSCTLDFKWAVHFAKIERTEHGERLGYPLILEIDIDKLDLKGEGRHKGVPQLWDLSARTCEDIELLKREQDVRNSISAKEIVLAENVALSSVVGVYDLNQPQKISAGGKKTFNMAFHDMTKHRKMLDSVQMPAKTFKEFKEFEIQLKEVLSLAASRRQTGAIQEKDYVDGLREEARIKELKKPITWETLCSDCPRIKEWTKYHGGEENAAASKRKRPKSPGDGADSRKRQKSKAASDGASGSADKGGAATPRPAGKASSKHHPGPSDQQQRAHPVCKEVDEPGQIEQGSAGQGGLKGADSSLPVHTPVSALPQNPTLKRRKKSGTTGRDAEDARAKQRKNKKANSQASAGKKKQTGRIPLSPGSHRLPAQVEQPPRPLQRPRFR